MGEKIQSAWLPLTPRGVAVFAHAPVRRLLLVQFIFALLVGATVAWFLYWECFPTVNEAIERLPPDGRIRSSTLDWPGASPQMLAEGRFLALTVDLDHAGRLRSPAHVQVEFGKEDFRVRSLLGMMEWKYPTHWVIQVNQTELKPRWGAWRPALLAGGVAGTVVGLMLCWFLLAALYAPVILLAGFFTNRDLNMARSWQLGGTALMPGAVIMTATILLFSFGMMDVVGFLFFFCAHLLTGWFYLFLSLPFVSRTPEMALRKKNPFADRSR